MKFYVLLSTVGLFMLGFLFYEARQDLAASRQKLAETQQRVVDLEGRVGEVSQPAVQENFSAAEKLELVRLRAEVTALRREGATLKHLATMRSAEKKEVKETTLAGDEMLKYLTRTNSFISQHDQVTVESLNQKHRELKEWWKAMHQYAEANEGRLPTNFSEAQEFLPSGFTNTLNVSNFVRPHPDALPVHLPTLENPSMTVVFKEHAPLVLGDGTVCNIHLFADGRVIMFED